MKPIFYIDLVWERLILNDKMERLKMARGALKTFTSA